MIGQRKPEETSHKGNWNYHEGVTLWVCLCVYHQVLFSFFPPNTLLVSLLSIFVEFFFCKTEEPGPCHWPLVKWLGFGALTAVIQPQSLAGSWSPASSHCRPRPPGITWTSSITITWEFFLRPYPRPTELAVWGTNLCFDESSPGKPSGYQHLRTTGVVIEGMTSGARWLYFLGQFICLFPICKMVAVPNLQWGNKDYMS